MADLDPYHKWLGIPPKDQPPNHYRLLAIELFESDADVIEGAADQRMAHVRTFQSGQNSALSQRLLNELSAAKLCLLNPQNKADYDRQLKEKLKPADSGGLQRAEPTAAGADAALFRPIPLDQGEGALRRESSGAAPLARPAPVPQANRIPVVKAVPLVKPSPASASDHASSSAYGGLARRKPLWQQPAALAGGAIVVVLLALVGYLFSSGRPSATVVATNGASTATPKVADAAPSPVAPSPVAPSPVAPSPVAPTPKPTLEPPAETTAKVPPTLSSATPTKPDFEILEANWGAGDKWVRVTDALRKQVKNDRLMMIAWSNLFGSPEDPAQGISKVLQIQYRARGRQHTVEIPDVYFVYLDGNPLAPPTSSPNELELLEARYGAGVHYVDVLPQLRTHLRDGRLAVPADAFADATADELAKAGMRPGVFKVLWVRYRNATGEHFTYAWNADMLTIDSHSPQAAGPPVDLLSRIDVARDAVEGNWTLSDGMLHAPAARSARLEIPYEAPDDYALTVVAEGDPEIKDLSVLLPVDGRQALCVFDGFQGVNSGLQFVNGRFAQERFAKENSSYAWRRSRMFEQDRPNTLLYVVHKRSVRVFRDGAEIIRWSGDPQTFSIAGDWTLRSNRRIGLQAFDTPYRVKKLELVPLAPEESPMLTQLEAGKSVDLLKQIDFDRDLLHGNWEYDGRSLISPDSDIGSLQLPAVVPESYRLDVAAQRERGNDCLTFTLPIGGKPASVMLDGRGGRLSGLQAIDGKNIDQNETKYEGSLFADGQPKQLTISVDKNHVQVACDGKQIVDWMGDVNRLSANVRYNDRIYVGDFHSRYRITKLELTPMPSGSGAASTLPLAGGPVADQPRKLSDLTAGNATKSETRLPVPDDEAQKQAKQDLQKKYRLQFASAKSPEQKRLLAQELVQKAAGDRGEPDKAYASLSLAVDLAKAAGDLNLAWQAIDQLARSFAVDGLALRLQSLAGMSKGAKSPGLNWDLADGACRLMLLALADGDAATVEKAAAQAKNFARRTKNRELQKMVANRADDAGKLAAELTAVAHARETLKTMPDDPQANFTVGRYELCASGDWGAALPKLAKGSDEGWKKLADDEKTLSARQLGGPQVFVNGRRSMRSQPADAPLEMSLADAWWSRAEDEPWPGKHYLQMRAAHFYGSALRSIVDLDRARAIQRVKLLLANDDGLPAWELFKRSFSQNDELSGEVVRLDSGAIETTVEYDGSIEVTLLARTTANSIRLSSHHWGWGWNYAAVPNRWHVFRFVITPLSYGVFVDGLPLQADTSQTPRKLRSAPVSIHANDNEVIEIKKFVVRAIN